MSTHSSSYAESHSGLSCLGFVSHHSYNLVGSNSTGNSGKLDSWGNEYFRLGSYLDSGGILLTGRSGSTNTQGSAKDFPQSYSSKRRLQVTKEQLLAYQLYANDINFVSDQNDYLNNLGLPQNSLFADFLLVQTNMVMGYTIKAQLTQTTLTSLLYYGQSDSDGLPVLIRLSPNYLTTVHVARFLNEWYITSGLNPPHRHRLWSNPRISNEFISRLFTNIDNPNHRDSLSSPITLPPGIPGVLYPTKTMNIDYDLDGLRQRRIGLIYPDRGYKTIRDFHIQKARAQAQSHGPTSVDRHSGNSMRSTISDLSGDKPFLNRVLIKNNLGSGNFDDLSNRVNQLPKSHSHQIDILEDVISMIKVISVCHEIGVVHNGITGHHVLKLTHSLPGETITVAITGWDFAFTIAEEDLSEAYRKRNISDIPDLLPYMSPENTGETSNLVDYRTDIYSVGIVIYELLVGCLPFQSESPTRLRRMHLNEKPIAPSILCQGWLLPKMSDIIMKCLEKDPDNRYQDCHSLLQDLLICVQELLNKEDVEANENRESRVQQAILENKPKCGLLPNFPSSITKIASDLISREALNSFQDHVDGVCYIFVEGESGVGKTTLLQEMQASAVSKYNFVIPWNYNCSDMNVTKFGSAVHGLQTITNQILSSSKENIAEWRHLFTSEIDMDMSILFSSVPELKTLLGPRYKSIRSEKTSTIYPSRKVKVGLSSTSLTDVVDSDSGNESDDDLLFSSQADIFKPEFEEQNLELRFGYIIKKVFSLISARGLTVILDGLQWCPLSEFLLIKDIADYCILTADSPNICIIGAYNTSSPTSGYDKSIVSISDIKDILRSDGSEMFEFKLESLNLHQFEEFAKQVSFPASSNIILNDALVEAIFERSLGNRLNFLMIMRYLHLMNQSEKLSFEEMGNYLQQKLLPKTQPEIVSTYYRVALTDREITLLKFAAIIGVNGTFKLSDLLIVSGLSLSDVYESLHLCIETRILVPSGIYYKVPFNFVARDDSKFDFPDSMIWELTTKARYRFQHDAFQLTLLKELQEKNEFEEFHRLCGLRYQKKMSTEVNVNVAGYMTLCCHLSFSADVARAQEYEKYYDALVLGGRYALATSNLDLALQFFTTSARFISKEDKRRKIKNLLTICQTNYLLKNYDDCIKMIQQAQEEYGRESKPFLFLEIRCLFHLKQYKLGMKKAVSALQSLDVEVSTDQAKCEAIAKKYLTSVQLSVTEIRAMKAFKKATSQKFLLISTLILDLMGPSYILGLSQLRLALMTQMILLMNTYGKTPNCSIPLLHFANYYIQPHDNMSTVKATELSKIALDLINSEEGASTSLSEQINEFYVIFMAAFRTNTNELLRYSDNYDFTTTGVVKPHDSSLSLLIVASGFLLNLMNGNTTISLTKESLSKIVQFDSKEEYEVFGKALELWQDEISFEDYSKAFQKYKDMRRPELEFPYLANAILWCVAEGRYKDGAKVFLERTYYISRKLPISILHLEVYYYSCICLCFNDSPSTKNVGLQLARKIMKVFESWSNACYGNFGPKRLILDACLKCSSSAQSSLSLLDSFEEAIESATKEGRWIDVALANHLCASWLLRTSESTRRAGYFAQNALQMYSTMKSEKQVERVKKEFATVFNSHNWAGVGILPDTLRSNFADGEHLNRKLEHIFNGDKKETSKKLQRAFRQESQPSQFDDRRPSLEGATDHLNDLATQSELSQAIKLCLTISESSNIDSIVSSLLESILQFSGVDYGAIVLNSPEGEPSIKAIGTLNNLYRLDNDPLSLRTDLVPYMLVIHCLLKGEVINKEANARFFDERFGIDHYYTHNPCSSALAIPIKTSTTLGMVYLERHASNREMTTSRLHFDSKMIDLLDLLCSQAAVAFSKSIVYSQMEIAKKTAEDATAEKASFLANMSHEIRTPFNSLFACSVFLLDTELNTTQREYVETIKNSALVTLSIVDGILAFSKIEHGSFNLDNAPFSINDTIESAIQVSSEQAETNDLELVYFNKCSDIDTVIGDSTRIRQIIINLVGNAVKFTLRGHIIVTLSAVQISGNRFDMKITVDDTGIGIPEGSRSKVFGAFSQVDGSSRRVYGGSGLGLAISKKLADIMNGSITFDSTEGVGSLFCFSCPLEVQSMGKKYQFQPKEVAIATKSGLRMKSLRKFLEYYGCKVTSFDSIESLVASQHKFDIVFLGTLLLGERKLHRSELADPNCKIFLIAKFGQVFSELSLDRMEIDALIFTPINRTKVEEILKSPTRGKMKFNKPIEANGSLLLSSKYPLKILIAEDNAINMRVALQHLKKLGYIADHAKDGVEAVQRCEEKLLVGEKYDVVFMDIQMPRKDGISATIDIHEIFFAKGRPDLLPRIIALTANVAGEDREKCIDCGMVDFVSKPILPEELQRVLTKVGEERRLNGVL